MSLIPDLPKPGTLHGHEMTGLVTGQATNARLPLSHLGGLPRGAIHLSLAAYLADTASTADAEPGAGNVRWNHATQDSATEMYISDTDTDAVSHAALWATLNSGGFLYVYQADDLDIWQKKQLTSVTDAAGYLKVGVTHQASSGTFADDAPLFLTLQQPDPSPGVDRNIVTAVSSSSGVVTIDCSLGDYFVLTLTENVTGWALTNVPPACSIMIRIMQGAGTAYTVAWPASFRWQGGTDGVVSTALGSRDRLAITTDDTGATWDATLAKAFAP
jgi:hypothetical protein